MPPSIICNIIVTVVANYRWMLQKTNGKKYVSMNNMYPRYWSREKLTIDVTSQILNPAFLISFFNSFNSNSPGHPE